MCGLGFGGWSGLQGGWGFRSGFLSRVASLVVAARGPLAAGSCACDTAYSGGPLLTPWRRLPILACVHPIVFAFFG